MGKVAGGSYMDLSTGFTVEPPGLYRNTDIYALAQINGLGSESLQVRPRCAAGIRNHHSPFLNVNGLYLEARCSELSGLPLHT